MIVEIVSAEKVLIFNLKLFNTTESDLPKSYILYICVVSGLGCQRKKRKLQNI